MTATRTDPALDTVDAVDGDAPSYEPQDERPQFRAPAWMISLGAHLLLLFMFSLVVMIAQAVVEEAPPVRMTAIEPPTKVPEKPQDKRTLEQTTLPLDVPVEAEKPSPISEVQVEVTEFSREEETDNPVPKGREEAKADSEMGGQGAFMAIGAGGGASGMFGSRSGGGKQRALGRFGGSKGSENAVDAALRWFKKHQGPNGGWEALTYALNCTDAGAKCEPGEHHRNGTKEDAGLTGLALLCYLGAGYDHRMPSKYRVTVKKGIDWLLALQTADGSFGEGAFNYEHAIATMALAEAYAMSNDGSLRTPAQRGVDAIIARRAPAPAQAPPGIDLYGASGLAWGDFVKTTTNKMHTSACGWNVQALKSAKSAGLDTKDGMGGAKVWLDGLWRGTCAMENKDPAKLDPYKDETTLAYYWDGETGKASTLDGINQIHNLACIGVLCGSFLGSKPGDVMIETMANHVDRHNQATAYPCNLYYVYYGTFGIFMLGGERWTKWNVGVRDMLVAAQRRSADDLACFDGSWDFQGNTHYGAHVGRLLSTALACLSLEVYYRYLPIAAGGAAAKPGAKPGAK